MAYGRWTFRRKKFILCFASLLTVSCYYSIHYFLNWSAAILNPTLPPKLNRTECQKFVAEILSAGLGGSRRNSSTTMTSSAPQRYEVTTRGANYATTSSLRNYHDVNHTYPLFLPFNNKRRRLIFSGGIGRLGNQMFKYASALGVSLATGRRLEYIASGETGEFVETFPNVERRLGAGSGDHGTATTGAEWPREKGAGVFCDSLFNASSSDIDIRVEGYLQSYKYFWQYNRKLKEEEFVFDTKILEKGAEVLRQIGRRVAATTPAATLMDGAWSTNGNNASTTMPNLTYIGVHYRAGDMAFSSSLERGYVVAPPSYVGKAMTYFRCRYPRRIFVVASENQSDAKRRLATVNRDDVMYLGSDTASNHLAVLALCNHTIITTGTYSWWAGWLAGGEVTYYGGWRVEGTDLAKEYNADDFYPPSWISIDS